MPKHLFVKGVGIFYLLTYQTLTAYYLSFVVIRPGKTKTKEDLKYFDPSPVLRYNKVSS